MTPISGGKYVVVTPAAKPTKCAQTIEITVKTPYRYGENDIELVEGNAKAQLKQWPGQPAARGDGKVLEPYATDGWVTLRTDAGVCTYKPE